MSTSYTGQVHGMARRAIIRMGPEHTVIGTLELDDIDGKLKQELEVVFGNPPNISVQSMCTADDLKAYIPSVSGIFVFEGSYAWLSLTFIAFWMFSLLIVDMFSYRMR